MGMKVGSLRRPSSLALLAGVLCFAPLAARADDLALARDLYQRATAASESKDYRTAAQLFEEADRSAPRANAVFNAGQAWDEAGDSLRAADAFATALERGDLDASVAGVARARLFDLETKLQASVGSVRVKGPPGTFVSVAHASRRPVPVRVHVSPGDIVVMVDHPGGAITRHTVRIEAGKITDLVPSEAPPVPVPRMSHEPPPVRPPPPRNTWARPLGWTLFATGVAAIGAGVGVGVRGLQIRNEWDQSGHDPTRVDLHDEAIALRTWANVAFAAGGVLAATGLSIVIFAPSPSRTAAAAAAQRVWLEAGPGHARLSFAF